MNRLSGEWERSGKSSIILRKWKLCFCESMWIYFKFAPQLNMPDKSGKINVFSFSRWIVAANALVRSELYSRQLAKLRFYSFTKSRMANYLCWVYGAIFAVCELSRGRKHKKPKQTNARHSIGVPTASSQHTPLSAANIIST